MSVLQGIIIAIILIVWSGTFIQLRNNKINLGEFMIWSFLWLGFLVLSAFPRIPSIISSVLGVGRGVDLVIYASIFILFLLTFKLYVRIENQGKEITNLVRELAFAKQKKPKR
jgi:small membrane protein